MSDADVTNDILDALIARANNLIWASELCLGPKLRRIDFWSISPQAGKGYLATSYEIKVSRPDFKKDTADKQRMARLYCDQFYYVAPKGLIKPDEVPDWAGLQEWDGSRFSFKVHAPSRDKDAPSWELLTAVIRYSGEVRRDTNIIKSQLKQAETNAQRYQRLLHSERDRVRDAQKEIRALKNQLKEQK